VSVPHAPPGESGQGADAEMAVKSLLVNDCCRYHGTSESCSSTLAPHAAMGAAGHQFATDGHISCWPLSIRSLVPANTDAVLLDIALVFTGKEKPG
jgi:hypothetical protein